VAEPRPTVAVLLSLVIGTTGGALFYYWRLPLPWMLGSMIFVSVCALSGVPVRRYMPLRNVMVAVLGVLLGSFFTVGIFSELLTWGGAILIMIGYVVVTTAISLFVFRTLGYMDVTTAYFSSTPGGLGVMVLAGEEAGGDHRLIPVAHATRVFMVVLTIPFYFVVIGQIDLGNSPGFVIPVAQIPNKIEILILTVCGIGGYWLAKWCGLTFGQILGPMILAGAAYATGLVTTPLPVPLVTAAQIVIGSTIGAQFRGVHPRTMFRPAIAAIVATSIMLVVAVLSSRFASPLLDLDEKALLLALAPGGLAEMSLIAISIKTDTAFIATMHLVRITLIAGIAPALFQLLRPRH
jgi:membrane AbrB-like protein